MDLYYDQQKVASLPVTPEFTIGQIKGILSNWLTPQGVTNYTVRLLFNNGTELSSVVFETNKYDNMNFQAQANLILGGSVYVSTVPVPSPANVAMSATSPIPATAPASKTAGLPAAPSPKQVEYTQTGLNALRVPELKEILKTRGLKVSGNKGELINRILGGAPAPSPAPAPAPAPSPSPAPAVPLLPAESPISPMATLGPLGTDFPDPFAGGAPVTTSPLAGIPDVPEYEEGKEDRRTIYVINNDNDEYTGFTTKTKALRYWLNNDYDGDIEDLGLEEPIDYMDDEVEDTIIDLMEDTDYSLVEVEMIN